MNTPDKPELDLLTPENIERLSALKDAALDASYYEGRRYQVGSVVLGRIRAEWESEAGYGTALTEHGIQLGRVTLGGMVVHYPAYLDTVVGLEGHKHILYRYKMDLVNKAKAIDIARVTIDYSTRIPIRSVKKLKGPKVPTEDESTILFKELERGASGLYRL